MKRYPTTLIIAGSDSSGGAGIQADIKTCSALGVFATTAITAITAQNTLGVKGVQAITPVMVCSQIDAVIEDLIVDSIKVGMLCNADIAQAVADILELVNVPVVLDPVMVSTSGHKLLDDDAIDIISNRLIRLAQVVTPNTQEAALLSGCPVNNIEDMHTAGKQLLAMGCKNVLMKGGHITGQQSIDILFTHDNEPLYLTADYIPTNNTHGTGCTLSSAIAAHLALGYSLQDAVRHSKQYISSAITQGAFVYAGRGHGALNHAASPQKLEAIKDFIPHNH